MAPQQLLLRSPLPGSSTIVLPANLAPADLATAICESLALPRHCAQSLRLSRGGKPWAGESWAGDEEKQWIEGEVGMRLRGGGAKKRCQNGKAAIGMDQCSQPALRLVGDCSHCSLQFCARHRLPEDHSCSNLASCRETAFQANKAKLESERTVGSKMVGA